MYARRNRKEIRRSVENEKVEKMIDLRHGFLLFD